jgi:drug/metabolite transporter (DMT)-like permease
MSPRSRATLIGATAVLLWSLLALLTERAEPAPPFLLTALCFAVGGAAGLAWTAAAGRLGALARVPLGAHAFATAGLLGYHALYFTALRLAPAAEAGLVAYLWPLLIVLGSGLLPGERLRAAHVAGAALAFAGVALLIGGRPGDLGAGAGLGLALAFLSAVVWAAYSVGSRRLGHVPTEALTVACLATAALAGVAHLMFEETVWPPGAGGWAAAVLLGLGPLGLAFFAWDVGMKRGDVQLLGTAAYAAPLLSTLLLALAGEAEPSPALGGAALLVAGGAALAARASARKPGRPVSGPTGARSPP